MKKIAFKHVVAFGTVLGLSVALAFLGSGNLRAQMPSMPQLPGGMKIPGMSGEKKGFSGLDAVSGAKELYGENRQSYPTPNIAVSGNHIVIAWPTGVVTVETIAKDGTIQRTVLGAPSEKNLN